MAFNTSTGVYTAPTGSTTASSGAVIASATWNSIFTDIAASFNYLGQANIAGLCVLSANYGLTDTATAQKAFNASTNGAITLTSLITYEFEAVYYITNTGTNSHTWATAFGGAATFTSLAYIAEAYTATGNALTAQSAIYATSAAATVVTAASSSATENVVIKAKGFMRINAGGTVIPQVKLSATTGGTLTMLANSYFRCWPVGTNTVTTVGAWS